MLDLASERAASPTDQVEADDRLVESLRRGQLDLDDADPLVGMLAGWRRDVLRTP